MGEKYSVIAVVAVVAIVAVFGLLRDGGSEGVVPEESKVSADANVGGEPVRRMSEPKDPVTDREAVLEWLGNNGLVPEVEVHEVTDLTENEQDEPILLHSPDALTDNFTQFPSNEVLSELTSLRAIDLSSTEATPSVQRVDWPSSLRRLDLSETNINWHVSNLNELPSLEYGLHLEKTQVHGDVAEMNLPPGLEEELFLFDTGIHGDVAKMEIPKGVEYLWLSYNNLTGNMEGILPSHLKRLRVDETDVHGDVKRMFSAYGSGYGVENVNVADLRDTSLRGDVKNTDFLGNPNLRALDLRNTNVTGYPEECFAASEPFFYPDHDQIKPSCP